MEKDMRTKWIEMCTGVMSSCFSHFLALYCCYFASKPQKMEST